MLIKSYTTVLCLLLIIKVSAQSYSVSEIKKYFASNADRLDLIEGIWKRSTTIQKTKANSRDTLIDAIPFENSSYMIVFKKSNCYVSVDLKSDNDVIKQGCSLIETENPNKYVRTTLYYNVPNVYLVIKKGEITSEFSYRPPENSNLFDTLIHRIEKYQRVYPTEKEIQTARQKNPEYNLEQGIESFQRKEYASAIKLLGNAIDLDPGLSKAYYFRASSYYSIKDFSHALSDINYAIRQKNNSADYYSLRGSIYLDLKNFQQSISDFSKSIDLKPNAIVYYNRSIAEYNINDLKTAVADCNKAIELAPSAAMYNQQAWYLFKNGDLKNALLNASLAIRLNAKDANAFDTRGCIYFENKQYNEALNDFNQAIKLNSTLGNSYLYSGRIKFSSGQKTEACKDWNIASALGETEANEYIKKYCR